PPYLKAGDLVGIISPAAKISAASDTAKVRQRFEEWGLRVKFGASLLNQDEPYFSGTDEERAADLQAMIDDKEVKAIVAYRGGYGSVRLLDLVDFSKLRYSPKWVVGYSDVTMLHLALYQQGVESIHGTMPTSFKYDQDDPSAESLRQALFGEASTLHVPPHPLNQPGEAIGRLIGGNLSILYSASGTSTDFRINEPTVLVIEDIGEYMYHIDRMMQNLKQSGKLNKISALIVGQFTDIQEADRFGVKHAYEVITRYTQPLNIPVIYDYPFGHSHPNTASYIGRKISVSVNESGAMVRYL
ncbi:MAG: LD-carboxypeptidase, partial [Lachnospiraceae bacterium]